MCRLSIYGLLLSFFIPYCLNAQLWRTDTAYVISSYSFNTKKSNDSLYRADVLYLICFPKDVIRKKSMEDIFNDHGKYKLSERGLLNRALSSCYLYPFINKSYTYSSNFKLIFNKRLIDSIQMFLEKDRYSTGVDIEMLPTFSTKNYTFIYKVSIEGFIDTLNAYSDYISIFRGEFPARKMDISRSFSYEEVKKSNKSTPLTTQIVEAKASVTLNKYWLRERKFAVFVENKGNILAVRKIYDFDK
jgi:hypothetical protein